MEIGGSVGIGMPSLLDTLFFYLGCCGLLLIFCADDVDSGWQQWLLGICMLLCAIGGGLYFGG